MTAIIASMNPKLHYSFTLLKIVLGVYNSTLTASLWVNLQVTLWL